MNAWPSRADRGFIHRHLRSVDVASPSRSAVRATYETIADSYAASRRVPWPEVAAFVDSLPAGCRVLDLGGGHGRHARVIAERGHRVLALDFSRRLLEIGRTISAPPAWRTRVEWVEADATAIPLQSDSLDACICIAVLHHLPSRDERLAALREIGRVLRPGGPAFLSAWVLDQPRFATIARRRAACPADVRGDVEVPWPMPDGSRVPRYYHLFQEGELESLIIESGLKGETFFRGAGNVFAKARRRG